MTFTDRTADPGQYRLLRTYMYGAYVDDVLAVEARNEYGYHCHFYMKDRQYNVASVMLNFGTDWYAGTFYELYEYGAYGSPTLRDWKWSDMTHRGSQVGNPFLFTGRFYDADAGLYQYRSRWYHPLHGRFLTRDPAGYVDGTNLYAYARNNPLRFLDPLGLFTPEGAMEAYRQQYADNEKAIRRWTGVWPPARACICSRGSG